LCSDLRPVGLRYDVYKLKIAWATYLSRCPSSGNGVPRRGDPWRQPWSWHHRQL